MRTVKCVVVLFAIMSEAIKILYVEDKRSLRNILLKYVELKGFDVEINTAVDGKEGLKRQETGSFDCIILDYKMPNLNGVEMFRELQDRGVAIPIIFFTASASQIDDVKEKSKSIPVRVIEKGGENKFQTLVETAIELASSANIPDDREEDTVETGRP